jgi:hypothetical protein
MEISDRNKENSTLEKNLNQATKTLSKDDKRNIIKKYIEPILKAIEENNVDKKLCFDQIRGFLLSELVPLKEFTSEKIRVLTGAHYFKFHIHGINFSYLNQISKITKNEDGNDVNDISDSWQIILKNLINYFYNENTNIQIKSFIHEYLFNEAHEEEFLPKEIELIKSIKIPDKIKQQKESLLLSKIPLELIYIILFNLTAKEVARFQQTCSLAYNIVHNVQQESKIYFAIGGKYKSQYCKINQTSSKFEIYVEGNSTQEGLVNLFHKPKKLKLFTSLFQALMYISSKDIPINPGRQKPALMLVKYFGKLENHNIKIVINHTPNTETGIRRRFPCPVSFASVPNNGRIIPIEITFVSFQPYGVSTYSISNSITNKNKFDYKIDRNINNNEILNKYNTDKLQDVIPKPSHRPSYVPHFFRKHSGMGIVVSSVGELTAIGAVGLSAISLFVSTSIFATVLLTIASVATVAMLFLLIYFSYQYHQQRNESSSPALRS